jgi:putative ABC transport system permease protein
MALRNLARNTRRSALTIMAVVVGTGILTVGLAWINGVTTTIFSNVASMAGQVRVATPAYVLREARLPLYENMAQTQGLVQAIEHLPEVRAFPVIRSQVTATVGDDIGENQAPVMGAPVVYYQAILGLGASLVEGRMMESGQAEVVLGRRVARDLGAHVGDDLVILGLTQDGSLSPLKLAVVGVVELGTGVGDKQIYLPLERARWLADIPGGAQELLVFGPDYRDADALAERVRQLPELKGLRVEAWSQREPFAQLERLVSKIFGFLSAIIVVVTAMVVLNTMLMSVLERTGEVGVLRAMGMERSQAVQLFVLEAMFLGGTGSAVGVLLGSGPALYLQAFGVNMGDDITAKLDIPVTTVMYAAHSPAIALRVFVLGFVIAILGAALPALRAASIQPVEAMRRRK